MTRIEQIFTDFKPFIKESRSLLKAKNYLNGYTLIYPSFGGIKIRVYLSHLCSNSFWHNQF